MIIYNTQGINHIEGYGVSIFYYQGREGPLSMVPSMSASAQVLRMKSLPRFKILGAFKINESGFIMGLFIHRRYLVDQFFKKSSLSQGILVICKNKLFLKKIFKICFHFGYKLLFPKDHLSTLPSL